MLAAEQDFTLWIWPVNASVAANYGSYYARGELWFSQSPQNAEMNFRTWMGTAPASEADLSITKSDSPDPVLAGNALQYTVRVDNAGPADAENVQVTDTLPPGVTFVSTSGCAEDPNGVPTCSLGTIASGSFKEYTINITVDPGTSGTITNQASVTSDTDDPDPENNSVEEDTEVQQSMTVDRITGQFVRTRKGIQLKSYAFVQDGGSAPLAGVLVTAVLDVPGVGTGIVRTATTNADGRATFKITSTQPRGTWQLCVTAMDLPGYDYTGPDCQSWKY
jgi:uncharacterized repeat protein (TIGR01451 family)